MDKRTKLQFSVLFVFLLIKSFLDGLGLGLIAPYLASISDSSLIFNHEWFKSINVFIGIKTNDQLIIYMSVLLVGFFILKNIFSLAVMYFQSKLVFSKRSALGKTLFKLYMNAPYSYHLEHNTAELDRNIRFESTNVYGFVQNFLLFCSNIFLSMSIFSVLLIANWQAVLVMSLFIFFFSFIFMLFTGKYNKIYGIEVQESQLHIGQALKEGLASIIESKLHNINSFFPNRYYKNMMINARANWRQSTLGSAPTLFFELLAVSSLVFVIIILFSKGININSALPVLGLFSFAFIRLAPSVTTIIKSLQTLKFSIPSVDVVYSDIKNINSLISRNSNKVKIENEPTDLDQLSIENLVYSFNDSDINVIDNLSFKINKGMAVGITGPSGSGKTTLLNLILGLLNKKNGDIKLNGQSIQSSLLKWREMIGYVPQSINLIDASIRENIALGIKTESISNKRIWAVLEEAKLFDVIKNLPSQLETLIGENGMRLSGGQRQRLGLARALYNNPKVIIFDEATSALDTKTEKKITTEIMNLSGKRTLIIVAHRISTIKDCDVIYYLEEGKIKNYGNFKELMELNKNFKELSKQE